MRSKHVDLHYLFTNKMEHYSTPSRHLQADAPQLLTSPTRLGRVAMSANPSIAETRKRNSSIFTSTLGQGDVNLLDDDDPALEVINRSMQPLMPVVATPPLGGGENKNMDKAKTHSRTETDSREKATTELLVEIDTGRVQEWQSDFFRKFGNRIRLGNSGLLAFPRE